jgi:hypothetical protein
VSGCCDEPGCRRTQPIRLYLGDLSGRVYAATRYTRREGKYPYPGGYAAQDKHDITGAMIRFIGDNPEWVLAHWPENAGSAPRPAAQGPRQASPGPENEPGGAQEWAP